MDNLIYYTLTEPYSILIILQKKKKVLTLRGHF